eukprot:7872931-Karenia_brevis.AAC.1
MCDLLAAPVSVDEQQALDMEIERLRRENIAARQPKASVVRRRLSLLNAGAEPGPSGLRNGTLQCLRRVRHGM